MIAFIAAVAVLATIAVTILRERGGRTEGAPMVSVSIYPLAHFTRLVAGGSADVHLVTPSGTEAHDFEPTPKDIKKVLESRLFIFNGAGFDPWAQRVSREAIAAGARVLDVSAHLSKTSSMIEAASDGHGHGDGHEGRHDNEPLDPHAWLDPLLAMKEVEAIRDALASVDPENAAAYGSRAEEAASSMAALHDEFTKGLADCRTREVIVAHDAFAYLARRYNLHMIPITGVFSGEEPSTRRLADVARLMKKNGIGYIMTEPLTSPRVAETISRETGARVLVLNPAEGLSREEESRSMGYVSIMRENLANLRIAMGCR